jgi:hypothetical protein
MAHARTLIPTLGSNGPFTVPFPYFAKGHVKARIAGIPVDYSWLTSSTILLDETPASSADLEIYRETPSEPLVSFQNGPTDAYAHNAALRQSLYVVQEALDTFYLTDSGVDVALVEAAAAAAASSAATALAAAAVAEDLADGLSLADYVLKDGSAPFTGAVTYPKYGLRPDGGPQFYESAGAAALLASGSYGPFTHGAARAPDYCAPVLRCLVADAGYSVGDETTPSSFYTSASFGISPWGSASQVGAVQGGAASVQHKSTGSFTTVSSGRWELLLRCFWM